MQSTPHSTAGEAQLAQVMERLAVPAQFQRRTLDCVPFNDIELWRARFGPKPVRDNAPVGEHVSAIYDEAGTVFGFMRMEARLAAGRLPSRDEALGRAYSVLNVFAGDILEDLAGVWVKPHEERLMIGEPGVTPTSLCLSGLKAVFCNREDGRYTWVVLAGDGEVLAFERDIVIDTLSGERLTQDWLRNDALQTPTST